MNDSEFSDRLKNMTKPAVAAGALKEQIRLTLMNTRTSSSIGFALVCVPALFIGIIALHYGFGLPVPGLDWVENTMSAMDRQRVIPFLGPFVLIGAPLVACVVSLLGVLYVEVDSAARELRLFVKLRWFNLSIAFVSISVVAVVVAHALSDK